MVTFQYLACFSAFPSELLLFPSWIGARSLLSVLYKECCILTLSSIRFYHSGPSAKQILLHTVALLWWLREDYSLWSHKG